MEGTQESHFAIQWMWVLYLWDFLVLFCSLLWKTLKSHFFVFFIAVCVKVWCLEPLCIAIPWGMRSKIRLLGRTPALANWNPQGWPCDFGFHKHLVTEPHWGLRMLGWKGYTGMKDVKGQEWWGRYYNINKRSRSEQDILFRSQVPFLVSKIVQKWNEEQALVQSMPSALAGTELSCVRMRKWRQRRDEAVPLGHSLGSGWRSPARCWRNASDVWKQPS